MEGGEASLALLDRPRVSPEGDWVCQTRLKAPLALQPFQLTIKMRVYGN